MFALLWISGLFTLLFQALPDWKNFEEVLLWVVAGGSAAVVSAILSFLAENFEFWHKLNKNLKLLISLVLTGGVGALAYYLLSLPDLITIVQPYWVLFVTMVLAWFGSQLAYIYAKKSGYAQKTVTAAAKKK